MKLDATVVSTAEVQDVLDRMGHEVDLERELVSFQSNYWAGTLLEALEDEGEGFEVERAVGIVSDGDAGLWMFQASLDGVLRMFYSSKYIFDVVTSTEMTIMSQMFAAMAEELEAHEDQHE